MAPLLTVITTRGVIAELRQGAPTPTGFRDHDAGAMAETRPDTAARPSSGITLRFGRSCGQGTARTGSRVQDRTEYDFRSKILLFPPVHIP